MKKMTQKLLAEVIREIFNQEPNVEICTYVVEGLYGIKAGRA
jgi:hypothetical protein